MLIVFKIQSSLFSYSFQSFFFFLSKRDISQRSKRLRFVTFEFVPVYT